MKSDFLAKLNRPLMLKQAYWLVAIITLVALVLRVVEGYLEPMIAVDGVIYVQLADAWAETGEFPPTAYLPLLPFVMKTGILCGFSGYSTGIFLNLVLGSLLPLLAFEIVRVVNRKVDMALFAALLMAVAPIMIEYSHKLMRDSSYLFFAGCSILFALWAIKKKQGYYWILFGIAFVLGFTCRYEILELLPLVGLYFVVVFIRHKDERLSVVKSCALLMSSIVISSILWFSIMGIGSRMIDDYSSRVERIFRNGN